jgi:class 3 adenylate cyclase/predicted Ser/Thr protein kinase
VSLRRIADYTIIRERGRGGMGVVYQALSPAGATVALKAVTWPEQAEAKKRWEAIERFQREARAAHALTHPNICQVLDYGADESSLFIVMEFLDGQSLRELLQAAGAIAVARALEIMREVAEALAYAHGQGVVHRDVKPENIVVLRGGQVKLTDFGLASVPSETGLTKTGVALGTLAYMSPEQVRGERVDARSDLFSLGATFYEAMMGQRAFAGESAAAVMHGVLEASPLRAAGVPPQVCDLLSRCLQKQPAARFQAASELVQRLAGLALEVGFRGTEVLPSPADAAAGSAVPAASEQESRPTEGGQRAIQIAHVLCLEVVSDLLRTTASQAAAIEQVNRALAQARSFREARAAGSVQVTAAGSGMALVFLSDVTAPAQCAVEVAQALHLGTPQPVRMGIHSGLVQRQADVAGRDSFVGEGVNTAQRVAGLGEPGHILLSAQYAHWLRQFDQWAPAVRRAGSGRACPTELYLLVSEGIGRSDTPRGLVAPPREMTAVAQTGQGQRVSLLYRRELQPDSTILELLEERLRADGHSVSVDHRLRINPEWVQAREASIREADVAIAIISPKSLDSEMLAFEMETAHDQYQRTGKPVILPINLAAGEELSGPVGAIVMPLNQFRWSGEEDNPRLIAEVLSAVREPLKPRAMEVRLEPVGGAVPPDSPFYVRRRSDQELLDALERQESIILIRGARQTGKTSLQAQGVKRVRELGWRCAVTDFQKLSASQIASEEIFYRLLALTLSRQLQFQYDFAQHWLEAFGPNMNLENFLRELLAAAEGPLVWCMDEVDKLFGAPSASDFFGLVRSWHNSRSTEPGGCWDKLTVIIAYATEAHLFIEDLNQSPFNVGRRLELADFDLAQTADLNRRYREPLRSHAEVEALYGLIGGQPYLTRRALDVIATEEYGFAALMQRADSDEGPFQDHLKRTLAAVSRLPAVLGYARAVLEGGARPSDDAYHRLLEAGVIRQSREGETVFRCELYQRYLRKHLL